MTIDWQENLRSAHGCKYMSARDRERFLRSVKLTKDGCWLYIGPTTKSGRGMFGVGGRGIDARDAAYSMLVGKHDPAIAKPITTCGNKRCCSPEHLRLEPVSRETLIAAE